MKVILGHGRSYGKSFFKELVFRTPVIHISSDIQIFFDDLEKACRKKQYKKTKSKQPRYVYVVKRSEV